MTAVQRNRIIALAVAVLIVAVGAYALFHQAASKPSPAMSANATTTEATSSIPDITVVGDGDYTITMLPVSQAPDYNAPIVFSASITADVRGIINAQAATLRANIAKNDADFNSWIALGNLHKMAGDYAGATQIWDYASLVWPQNVVSFNNLADLYMNFTHQYAKAEANYLIEIQNTPTDLDSYQNLFTLYTTTSYTSGASAGENILKKGIALNPKAISLQITLARYYKAQGRTSDAQAEYQAAINNANAQGETALAAQIQQEKSGQ